MTYTLQLDLKSQMFMAIDAKDHSHVGKGTTVEQAVAALTK
ncbi:hypothetical protein [Lacticaseibacillus sharpeae]|nr:hypothetical protein [Lacticaseibacillus sharpeae]